jgi:hypothetical protein
MTRDSLMRLIGVSRLPSQRLKGARHARKLEGLCGRRPVQKEEMRPIGAHPPQLFSRA